jgi:hypothetical protein
MTKAAELILSQPSAKYQEHTHTHRQLTLHVCMLTSTLTQGESPHTTPCCRPRRRAPGVYKLFSHQTLDAHRHKHLGKNSKNTSRTARTGEQPELLNLIQQTTEINQAAPASKEEQDKHKHIIEAILYTNN